MKLFTIHPGADTSTCDVHNGLVRALEAQGHQILRFNLSNRISQSGSWLHWCWDKARKAGLNLDKPNPADVLYHANGDAILKALHHECEWILIFSAMYTPLYVIKAMKRAGFKVAIVFTESPYSDEAQLEIASRIDVGWTNERTSVPYLRLANPNIHYLPHAYDPEIHTIRALSEESVEAHDVVFVGTGFQERVDLLSAVDWTGINFGLYGVWKHVASRSKLHRYIRQGETPNDVTASLYRRAKIGLNIYRQSKGFGKYVDRIEQAESLGPRNYELAACGLFHLTDWRKEVDEIFGGLVPVFRDAKELRELVDVYLHDEEERQRIASLLPRAVENHTWDVRARQIINQLVPATSSDAPSTEPQRLSARPCDESQGASPQTARGSL